jgi:four helix bundle protein
MLYKTEDNPILKYSLAFAVDILKFTDDLQEKKKFTIANQLSRSGTSIGANIFESQGAESRADFIHKLKIAAKEAEETKYWLMLCREMKYIDENKLLNDLEVICKILGKIISSSKNNKTFVT